uniref:Uncharacterized protein n=1 Tax=Vespula pensylvanica TaxID=30213 RepID=A0A834KDV4_VESPE|nr:hypothetical protein H0235_015442 [Vespula pensylvanica]
MINRNFIFSPINDLYDRMQHSNGLSTPRSLCRGVLTSMAYANMNRDLTNQSRKVSQISFDKIGLYVFTTFQIDIIFFQGLQDLTGNIRNPIIGIRSLGERSN